MSDARSAAHRDSSTTHPSGAVTDMVGWGEAHGTSAPKYIKIISGEPLDDELIARYGGTFGGRVVRRPGDDGLTPYDLIVWAYSE